MSSSGRKKSSKHVSTAKTAGITMPPSYSRRTLKSHSGRVSKNAAIFHAAVLEYIMSEVIEGAVEALKESNKTEKGKFKATPQKSLTPRHVQSYIKADVDVCKVFGSASGIMAGGSVIPEEEMRRVLKAQYPKQAKALAKKKAAK